MSLLINALLVAFLAAGLSCASRLFGPDVPDQGDSSLPYETGVPPAASAAEHMAVSYIRFAVLFVVFDVDLAFLLPLAAARDRLDFAVMIAATVFLAWMGLMLAYLWKKGALRCN